MGARNETINNGNKVKNSYKYDMIGIILNISISLNVNDLNISSKRQRLSEYKKSNTQLHVIYMNPAFIIKTQI